MSEDIQNAKLTKAKDVIERANAMFEQGEITRTYEILREVQDRDVPKELHPRYFFLVLGVGLYGGGDPDHIRRLNRNIGFRFQPAMRYRLALRTGDLATAKKIRMQEDLPFDVSEDFGWSAALSCIWAGKRRMGLGLYHKRMHARNFGNFIPKDTEYLPFDGVNECGRVFLEQGVGDWLLHLAVMRRITKREDHIFLGEPRSEPFVRQYFPDASFFTNGNMPETLKGQTMHGSGDYLPAAYLEDNRFGAVPLVTDRMPGTNPVIGVCWRGGSAQNRREERRIPLHMFLDMLPPGFSYVALQADISPEEEEFLRRDGRVTLPNFDIRRRTYALFESIGKMAGIISVDSANWHFAGLSQVPIYALMNKTIHWYWGPKGDVSSVYPEATVCSKSRVDRAELTDWCQAVVGLHKALKSARAVPAAPNVADRPVFVVGAPRSGTSMVTGALAACRLWMGKTIGGNRDNEKGFFENADIRERLIKPALKNLGVDPAGVTSMIPVDQLCADPTIRRQMLEMIRAQGYDGSTRWGYKEPKLTLLWPLWADAFPGASWIILERDREAVVKSCLNTGFMARQSKDAEFWRHFINRYDDRLRALETAVPDVQRIRTDQLAQGNNDVLRGLVDHLGLTWNEDAVADFVDPKLFGRH